jgi:hypothetical protein
MKEKVKSGLEILSELYPETAEIVARIQAGKAEGFIPKSRRTFKECRSWPEAWEFVFRRACVHYDNFLKWEGNKIVCVVWPGPEFNDQIVGVFEKIAERIGPNNDLIEMRVIGTKVTPQGVAKLKSILPKAAINSHSREAAEKDNALKYVNTRVKWIAEMHARKAT